MRETPSIPKWALKHIRDQLGPGEEVINAVSFRHGLLSGMVLLNTSRGAALVTKAAVGEPRSALLTYPRDLLTFRCSDCAKRSLIMDATPPADVYCTHCGNAHRLEAPGRVEARHLKPKRSTGKKTAGKKTTGKKTTGKKTTGTKTTGTKTAAKKTAGKKTAGKKTTGKKSTGKKTTGKKSGKTGSATGSSKKSAKRRTTR